MPALWTARSRDGRPPAHLSKTSMACCAVVGAVLLAHAGLLGRSRWQADEYLDFAMLRRGGLRFALDRLLHWGSRPWSEALLTIYGAAVNTWHRPLSGTCEAVLWAGLLLACVGPAWFRGRTTVADPAARGLRMLAGLSLFALALLGHPISETFFWPAGSVAYLPTLAAAFWLFWCSVDGIRTHRWSAAAALTLAAGSSEVGLFLTLIFSGLAIWCGLQGHLAAMFRRARGEPRPSPADVASSGWLAPGLAVSAAVVFLLLRGRVGVIEIASSGPTLHHPLMSLRAALPQFGFELVTSGLQPADTAWLAGGIVAKVLEFFGARWCFLGFAHNRLGRDAELLFYFSAALVFAAYLSSAAALYQFGTPCCERHQTMRDIMVVLAIVTLGAWSAGRSLKPAPSAAIAGLPLTAAVLLLFAWRIPSLAEAYLAYPRAIQAKAQTWQSGLQAGSGSMTLVRAPNGGLISSGDFAVPGAYSLGSGSPWYIAGTLQFFGKTRLVVIQP